MSTIAHEILVEVSLFHAELAQGSAPIRREYIHVEALRVAFPRQLDRAEDIIARFVRNSHDNVSRGPYAILVHGAESSKRGRLGCLALIDFREDFLASGLDSHAYGYAACLTQKAYLCIGYVVGFCLAPEGDVDLFKIEVFEFPQFLLRAEGEVIVRELKEVEITGYERATANRINGFLVGKVHRV